MNNTFPKISLKKNEDKRILNGHLWIFSNEIESLPTDIENGEIVSVFSKEGKFLCNGLYNKNSLISVRKITSLEEFDIKDLLKERILNAKQLRETFYPNRNSYRLIFSESDFLPGLIIDKYNDSFVLQVNSFGVEKNINIINEILIEELNAKNIFTKNESYFRTLEGLPNEDFVYHGKIENEIIEINGIKLEIDFNNSHKTGFYFDQEDNRLFIEKIVNNKTVLDAFCNSGGFGLHSLKAGATKVTFLDSSNSELEKVKNNLLLNNFNNSSEFIEEDVFDYLNKSIENNIKYDVVMIDPPAFAKNKKTIQTAKKGYEKLNRLALSVISKNGYLVTSSCSFHLSRNEFIELINNASIKAGKEIQLIHYNEASLDHPVLPSMKETSYLKFAVFKVN